MSHTIQHAQTRGPVAGQVKVTSSANCNVVAFQLQLCSISV